MVTQDKVVVVSSSDRAENKIIYILNKLSIKIMKNEKNDIQLLKSPDEWTEPLQIGFVYKTPELKKSKNKKKKYYLS